LKYWGLALTEYDRSLVIDADVIITDPMDELMTRPESLIGVYDHGLDFDGSTVPPVQGGFLLFRPNLTDFEEVKRLTREGDWAGDGWKHSNIGWCYGGVGPDGLLSYYFNKDSLTEFRNLNARESSFVEAAPTHGEDMTTRHRSLPEGLGTPKVSEKVRMLAADRLKYDVVMNARLRHDLDVALSQGATKESLLQAVTSVHYTGDCIKPWTCSEARDWFCKGLMDKWWELRNEVALARGRPLFSSTAGCRGGYKAIFE